MSQGTAWIGPEEDAARLRVIADTLPAYVAYVDRELRYSMANRMYVEQFGRGAREIVGRPVAEVLGASFDNVVGRLRAALGARRSCLSRLCEPSKALFEAFFTTKGIGGTGLGLWVSSGIVKKHGEGWR